MPKRVILLILLSTLFFSFIVLLTLSLQKSFYDLEHNEIQFLAQETELEKQNYKFKNPAFALEVLSQLDALKAPVSKKRGIDFGLKSNNQYCNNHRAYFVEHPDIVFEETIKFISNVKLKSLTREKVIPSLGKDLQKEIGPHMGTKEWNNPTSSLKLEANLFFTTNGQWGNMDVGQHYSCLSQLSNHIPGHDYLSSKDLVANRAQIYVQQFKNRPQCFNSSKIFPKTWILYLKADCQNFFKALDSPKYQQLKEERGIVYIRKEAKFAHRAEGVWPVTPEEETYLRNFYDNGTKCGEIKDYFLIQNYIHNPLLLNGHKFDFRIYMLIASTNPLIAYYHDGFLRVTLANYDSKSDDKKVLLTNLALNQQIYDDVKGGALYEGMDEEQLKLSQQWSYERLQSYLLEKGIINDPNWLDNYLRPEFKKAMIHLLRMTSKYFSKHSSLYELHGVDFMLDTELNLWFVESNASPAIEGYSVPMEKFILKMVADHFRLVHGLLKSRMKRVIMYVNKLIDKGEAMVIGNGEVAIYKLEEKKGQFAEISKNYFEKEFEPSADNGFVKIIDENYEGVQRYQGLISEECL